MRYLLLSLFVFSLTSPFSLAARHNAESNCNCGPFNNYPAIALSIKQNNGNWRKTIVFNAYSYSSDLQTGIDLAFNDCEAEYFHLIETNVCRGPLLRVWGVP